LWSGIGSRSRDAEPEEVMTRCTVCGRPPAEEHCEICHRVARAVAKLAYAIGYDETGDEMMELVSDE
jgi:recombinational DNA repair protein RecR